MRLLRTDTEILILETVYNEPPPYAILSHRWLADDEEVTFPDIINKNDQLYDKQGWKKLAWCRRQALQDGYQYVWADTACIDKSSSQELTESINSMYRWYKKAAVCYVYLHDMRSRALEEPGNEHDAPNDEGGIPRPLAGTLDEVSLGRISVPPPALLRDSSPAQIARLSGQYDPSAIESSLEGRDSHPLSDLPSAGARPGMSLPAGWNNGSFRRSQWFTRTWTLQEMLAAKTVQFYDEGGVYIDELQNISGLVADITGIHQTLLCGDRPLDSFSIAQKMSWAAQRECTRIEDRAYSLLGLMGISMTVVYGEGVQSFRRLQEELLRTSTDDSIFAFSTVEDHETMAVRWPALTGPVERRLSPLLASSPSCFVGCDHITRGDSQYQMNTKEVNFRAWILTAKSRQNLWKDIHQWRLQQCGVPKHEYFANSTAEVLLDCLSEDDPSIRLLLSLVTLSDRPGTYYVNADHRVQAVSLHDQRSHAYKMEDFKVLRYPADASAPRNGNVETILFKGVNTDLGLELLSAPGQYTWNQKSLSVRLQLPKPTELIWDVYTSPLLEEYNAPTHREKLVYRYGRASWHDGALFQGYTAISNISIKRSVKSYFVVRSSPSTIKRRVGERVTLVEIEHAGWMRLCYYYCAIAVQWFTYCSLALLLGSTVLGICVAFIIVVLSASGVWRVDTGEIILVMIICLAGVSIVLTVLIVLIAKFDSLLWFLCWAWFWRTALDWWVGP